MKALCKLDAVELSVRHAIALRERNEARAFSPDVSSDEPNARARRSFRRKHDQLDESSEVISEIGGCFFFLVKASISRARLPAHHPALFLARPPSAPSSHPRQIEERNLLSVGYKNVIGARRASWRILSSIEDKERSKRSEANGASIATYRAKVEKELTTSAGDSRDPGRAPHRGARPRTRARCSTTR